jgi:hypothetical protein
MQGERRMNLRPRIHPILAPLIAYPLAAWLTMAGLFVVTMITDHVHLNANGIIAIAAAPVLLPLLLLLAALSNGSLEHRQLVEYGSALLATWVVCWLLIHFFFATQRT